MLSRFRSRLSFSNVVSLLALFVALGGSSYAAVTLTGKDIKNSSLSGKDVKNNSLTGKDVKGLKSGDVADRSLLAKDFKAGQLPAGAQGPKGDPGTSANSLFSWAHINSDGTFDPARSKDVLASAAGAASSTYCIDFAGFEPPTQPKIVQATLTTDGGADEGELTAGVNHCSNAGVSNGDVYVHVADSAGTNGVGSRQEFDVFIVRP